MWKRMAFLVLCLAAAPEQLRASSIGDCKSIDEFVKEVEAGRSVRLLASKYTLIGSRFTVIENRKEGLATVRRYSLGAPGFVPSEILQLEIMDEEPAKARERPSGMRQLRVRPHSVSHWINIPTSVVSIVAYGFGHPCPNTRNATCYALVLGFEGEGGALVVGLETYSKDGNHVVDQVTLEVEHEGLCGFRVLAR
jgi:hypothetical protein